MLCHLWVAGEKEEKCTYRKICHLKSRLGSLLRYANSDFGGTITGAGANISTSWSATKNAERLEHASCTVTAFGATSGDACTHLFVNK
jgi:hypothetical protein